MGKGTEERDDTPPFKRNLLFQALEERLLLPVDPVPAAVTALIGGLDLRTAETDRYTLDLMSHVQSSSGITAA